MTLAIIYFSYTFRGHRYMLNITHGYIDIFNHELQCENKKSIKLVTESNGVLLKLDDENRYNCNEFVDKIFQKVLKDIRINDSMYKKVKLKKSSLKFLPQNKPHSSDKYNEHIMNIKLHPSDDTAVVFIDELNIITAFCNEISCTKKQYIGTKNVTFEENLYRLITIPQHGIQISLNLCSNYNSFQDILMKSIYEDIHSCMTSKLKRINLAKWDADLDKTHLAIENIISDNMKILIA
jgi:hypothetical protein